MAKKLNEIIKNGSLWIKRFIEETIVIDDNGSRLDINNISLMRYRQIFSGTNLWL